MPDTLITCPQIYYVTPTEVNGVLVDFQGVLREGEVLTGTPTVTVSGMTASSVAIATTPFLCNGKQLTPYRGITFTLTGGTDGSDYVLKCSGGTSAGRTREVYLIVKVRVPTVAAP